MGSNSLNLRFPPEYEGDILNLLDANGVGHNTAMEFSAGPTEWIEVVEVLGPYLTTGLPALAAVIHTFVNRHKGKKFSIKMDGVEINADGRSKKEIQTLLENLPLKQAELDEATRKMFDMD